MEEQLLLEWDALCQLGPETAVGSTQFRLRSIGSKPPRNTASKKLRALRVLRARSLPPPVLLVSTEA
jgi:hypothetical protein